MKEIKNIKFAIQGKGKLKKAFHTPFGNVWANVEQRVFFFDSDDDAFSALETIAEVGARIEAKQAETLHHVLHTFIRLDETEVRILGDNITFSIDRQGELEPVVEFSTGILYANVEQKFWYFKAKHHGNLLLAAMEFKVFLAATEKKIEEDEENRVVKDLMMNFTLINGNYLVED